MYINMVVTFVLRSAPKLFSVVADAMEWIAFHQGVSFLLHCLNDYLTMGKANSIGCFLNLKLLIEVCHKLGFASQVEEAGGSYCNPDIPG